MTRPALAAALTMLVLTGCVSGPSRDVLLADCAERVGVMPPINFAWLDGPRPRGQYVWAAGTEVTPIQQAEIDRCMAYLGDRPALRWPW